MIERFEIAGWVAEFPSRNGPLCYGYGATELGARRSGESQFCGAPAEMRNRMGRQLVIRPVDADTASEILEMLATPW